MINPIELEEAYKKFSANLTEWVPDGVLQVDLNLLNELGLLNHDAIESGTKEDLTHYFHVIETADKVTLFSEQFAIWIVPKLVNDIPSTMTYIALLHASKPHLEIVFSSTGVYNTPKYILKILQHFLTEVKDTEAMISAMGKKA
jgi:hypothetical protein